MCCDGRSAGLVAHPLFVEDSQRYLGTLALSEAYKVRLLQYLPQSFGEEIDGVRENNSSLSQCGCIKF